MGQMVKGAYFSEGFDLLESKKKKRKEIRVFSMARGGGRRTIFRLLCILPKITDETNGERCILFRGV